MLNTLLNVTMTKIIIDTLASVNSIDTIPLFVPEIPPIRLEICERITELVLMRQPKPIFTLVVPEIIIGLTLVMAFGNFCCNGNYNKNDNITNTGRRLYLGIGYLIALFVYYLDFEEYQMSSSDIIDTSFSVLISKILLICFSILLLFLKVNLFKQVYYAAVIMFFSLGLVSAANITLFYICFEALSLLAYGLLAAPKTVGAVEATLKYYGFGLIVSACLGFGITFLSIELISQNLNDITLYIPTTIDSTPNVPFILAFAIFLILVAFAHKLSLFPFHSVLPDIYEASSWFTISVINICIKLPIAFTLIRFWGFLMPNAKLAMGASYLILWISLISILIGCLGAITQTSLKRFFSYTSINQLGFIALGLSNSSFFGIQSSFIYLVIYMCSFLLFFLVTVGWTNENETILNLVDFKPIQKVVISITLFSMMGIPPFAGFMGKFFVWSAFIDSIGSGYAYKELVPLYMWAFFTSLITSLISGFYYLRIIKIMFINHIQFMQSLNSWPKLSLILIFIICLLLISWPIPICWKSILQFSITWTKSNYSWVLPLL